MALPASADAVVVGGGIQGVSLAYHLARRGLRRVLLIERQRLAVGATGRSTALVQTHYSHPTHLRWARRFLDFFTHAGEILGADCGFVACGMLWLVPPGARAALAANIRLQNQAGIASRVLAREEIAALFPPLEVGDLEVAGYDPTSGYADPVATTRALAGAARRLGVAIVEGLPVRRILVRGGRAVGVETAQGPVEAPVVAVAAGAGARTLAATAGLGLPIRLVRHEVGVFLTPPDFPARFPAAYGDRRHRIYWRPHGAGRILVAFDDVINNARPVEDEAAHGAPGDPALLADLGRRLAARIPALGGAALDHGYAALNHLTPDDEPILGAVAEVPGLYLSVGWSHGFKMGPVVGEDLARCILDGPAATPHLAEFRWSRFAEGRPIRSPNPYDETDARPPT